MPGEIPVYCVPAFTLGAKKNSNVLPLAAWKVGWILNDRWLPVYVVIVNWNLFRDTIGCILSIRSQNVKPIEIIVVDNGSDNDSVARIREKFPDVHIIENRKNRGFAAACNQAIRFALKDGAASVLLLNNDTVAWREMLTSLVSVAQKKDHVAVVSPMIYCGSNQDQVWNCAARRVAGFPIPRNLDFSTLKDGRYPVRVDYITGCAMLIHSRVFQKVGLFDESFFMYFEDLDFCERLRKKNLPVWLVPEARLFHKVAKTSDFDPAAKTYNKCFGRARFYRKHSSWPHRAFFSMPYLFVRLVLSTIEHILDGKRELIAPSWKGTLEGLKANNLFS